MSDYSTYVIDLVRAVEQFRDDREWEQFHSPKNLACAIASEAGELLDIFRWRADTEAADFDVLNRAADELADVLILALSFASVCHFDVANIVLSKMESNAIRYPIEQWRGRAE